MERTTNKEPLKIATDCSGIGAPEEALKELGVAHEVVFACENDKFARQTYEANHSAEIFYDDIRSRDNSQAPGSDIYFCGFPCQAFSLAGSRLGFDDIRGTIFFNTADYITNKRPAVFVMENVEGLLSHDKPKGSKAKFGRTFSTILSLLAKTVNGQIPMGFYDDNLGYNVYWKVLNSKFFDVPQNRDRVFIVGFRDDVNFSFPHSTTVSKRLADICEEAVDEKYYLTEKFMAYLFRHKEEHAAKGNGFGFQPKTIEKIADCLKCHKSYSSSGNFLEEPLPEEIANAIRANNPDCPTDNFLAISPSTEEIANCIRANGALNSTDNIIEEQIIGVDQILELTEINNPDGSRTSQTSRIFDPAGISPAIDTKHNGKIIVCQKRYRRLTPLECMRAQGFPDDFIKPCSNSQTYKQAGNSITVTVLKAIIRNILSALKYYE